MCGTVIYPTHDCPVLYAHACMIGLNIKRGNPSSSLFVPISCPVQYRQYFRFGVVLWGWAIFECTNDVTTLDTTFVGGPIFSFRVLQNFTPGNNHTALIVAPFCLHQDILHRITGLGAIWAARGLETLLFGVNMSQKKHIALSFLSIFVQCNGRGYVWP